MKKRAMWWALACAPAIGQSLLTLNTGSSAAQWTGTGATVPTYRVEFRVENLQKSTSILSNGAGIGLLNCTVDSSATLLCAQGADGTPDGIPISQLTAGQDVRARFQRDGTGLTYTLETWSGNCTGYRRQQFPITNGGTLPQAATWTLGPSIDIAFARGYSALNTAGDCPADAPASAADLFDFTFETASGSTLVDRSAHHYTASAAGASFASSAVYPPQAFITGSSSPKPVFRAGQALTLSGATSVSFTYPGSGAPAGFFWTQTGGPAASGIGARTGSSASFTPPIAGEYTYQLTVRDSAGASSASLKVGAVATDANDVVVVPNADFSFALGNTLMHGASPWPWFESTEIADIDALASLMETAPVETAGPGTCTIPSTAPNHLNASGQIEASVYGNVAAVCTSNAGITSGDVGTRIALNWDPDGDGSFKGRFIGFIDQVDNSATCSASGSICVVVNNFQLLEPPASFASPLAWGRLDATYGPYNANDQNSFILMFYEAGLAVARAWQRTGLSTYQTQFHGFCDNWWRWSLDSGYNSGAIARNFGLHTMIACAADPTYSQPANMWAGILRLDQSTNGNITTATGGLEPNFNPTLPGLATGFDARESSYILRTTALLAKLGGAHGLSTAALCTALANQVQNMWIQTATVPTGAASSNYAFWPENLFLENTSFPGAANPPITGPFGTSPWRSNGLPQSALIYSYLALNDPAACNNPALAAQLYSNGTGLIVKAANFVWDYGRSADGGLFFNTLYETANDNEDPLQLVYNNGPFQGSIAVTNGSPNITGTNTLFTRQFYNGAGMKINGSVFPVSSVSDNTHLTLSAAYTGATASGVTGYSNTGTLAVTNGSTSITGAGTGFTHLFAPCDGTTYIGIVGNANPAVDRYVAKVVSCADDTHMTINTGYPGTTEGGLNFFVYAPRALSNCGPVSVSLFCEMDIFAGRNLSADITAGAAWLFRQTQSPAWKSRMEYYTNKLFGGAAGGSGSLGSPTGTAVYNRPGTISVANGSAIVTGTGTAFLSQFACNGSDSITIADNSGGFTWASPPSRTPVFYTLRVASCANNLSMTVAGVYPGTTASNISMFYNATDGQWQGADGGVGNLGEILPVCRSNAPPCGIGDLAPKYGKPLGMASGAGNVPVALADRVGGLAAPNNRAVSVPFNAASVAGATQVTVILTNPDGTVSSNTCGASPCTVIADGREGGMELAIQYKSAAGAVLASSSQPVFFKTQ